MSPRIYATYERNRIEVKTKGEELSQNLDIGYNGNHREEPPLPREEEGAAPVAREPTYEELEQRVKDLEAEKLAAENASRELRLEAERFRDFADLMPEIVFEMDERGVLTFVNRSSYEITGYSREDFERGFEATRLLVDDDRDRVKRNMLRLFQGEEPGMSEYTAQRKDGSLFPALVRSTPVYRKGRVVGLRGFVIDATERKRAEEALRESEEKYRQLFITESDALVVAYPDTGEIIETNDAALSMYGYSKEEFLELKVPDFSTEPERTREAMREHLRAGHGKVPLRYHKRKDGTTFPVEISTSTFTLRGRQVVCGAVRDISDRMRIEEELRRHRDELEDLVSERTDALEEANRRLRQEIGARKRTEEALRESEARYRLLVEQMPAVTYTARLDQARTTEYVSPQIEGFLGFTQEDYARDPDTWRKSLHPDDRDRVLVEVEQAREKGAPLISEYRMVGRNGKTVWFRDQARIVHDEEGQPLFLQGIMLDITAHRRVEAALRESEERFRTVFEGSLDAIILADPETGEILDANPTACEAVSLPHGKIIGLPYMRFVAPGSEDHVEELFRRVAQDETLGQPSEIPAQGADGNLVTFESLGQIIQIDGKPVALVVLRDITGRKEVEKSLRESEARYRRLFDESPVALWEVDASPMKASIDELRDGGIRDLGAYFEEHPEEVLTVFMKARVTDTNRANVELFQADSKQLFLRGLPKITTEESYRMSGKELASIGEGKTESEVRDVAVRTFKGEEKQIYYRWSVVPGYEHTFEKVLVSVMDITEHKRMERELQKIQKLESLGVLAGGIAHDFNNILTAISTNLSMAKLYGDLRDDISEMLTDAEKASARAKNLTQQLLAFAKGGTPVKKPVSISTLITTTAAFSLSGSNARCEFALPDDLWLAEVDEGQIGQVLQNLIINADQAMPRGGTIKISAENVAIRERGSLPLKNGLYLRISVTDQGAGVPRKNMPHIFDPFFTTKQKGSGLGLATAFSIVNNHSGHIEVESRVEEGSTFVLYLPALGRTSEEKEQERKRLIRGEGRILLVDDEEIIWRAAGEALTRMGYEVQFAEDGAAGLELYREAMDAERPFHAVIMDLTIPGGMGGREAVGEILEIDPYAKIVASSGYSNDPVMSDFRKHGFCGIITKPYRIEELGELMSRVTQDLED
jgi:PAS domain S-box-containing protein